jgi:DNA-directed RNA polymerase specialized sigma24 family protein
MPAESFDDAQLIAQAKAGQRLAFERLLVRHQDRLADRVGARMRARLRGVLDEGDILQEIFAEGWKSFAGFEPEGDDALFGWLARIAEHRLLNALKAQRALKRGGPRRQVLAPSPCESRRAAKEGQKPTSRLEQQNRHLLEWETHIVDTRIHGTTRKQVSMLFTESRNTAPWLRW